MTTSNQQAMLGIIRATVADVLVRLERDLWPEWYFLAGQAMQESTLRPAVPNPNDPGGGSLGLFQFTHDTWEDLRKRLRKYEAWAWFEPEAWEVGAVDPVQATTMAVFYWRVIREELAELWGTSIHCIEVWQVLGAYNDGPGDWARRFSPEDPYDSAREKIPKEIQSYIEHVYAYAREFRATA